jgi:hypothetical protein
LSCAVKRVLLPIPKNNRKNGPPLTSVVPIFRGNAVYQDFSAILVIAASPPLYVPSTGTQLKWSEVLKRVNLSMRDITLIWDWHYSSQMFARLVTFTNWARSANWTPKSLPHALEILHES